jgi:bacterioferritin
VGTTEDIIAELTVAYWMEFETTQNYLANSINLITVRAEEIKKSLAADLAGEFGHAQELAQRIHVLGGTVPGSMAFKATQAELQPGPNPADVGVVIKGVIAAEEKAIAQYNKIIKLCDGVDYVTQDICVTLLADEESHRREFLGYLAEYDTGS